MSICKFAIDLYFYLKKIIAYLALALTLTDTKIKYGLLIRRGLYKILDSQLFSTSQKQMLLDILSSFLHSR